MIRHIWKELIILLLIFGGVWTGFSYYSFDPIDKNPFAISAENEKEMSDFIDKYMMQDFDQIQNPKLDSSLSIILTRLTSNMDTVSYDYQLHVVDDPQINAFTSLNGNIYIFTGLIDKLETAEELAIILAHEIGHAEKKHVIEKMVKAIGLETFFSIITGGDTILLSELTKLGISTAFDRKSEEAADLFALELALKSNLNPRRLGQFFIKLKGEENNLLDKLEFIRTHPLDSDRIKASSDFEIPDDFEETPIELEWGVVKEMI